MKIYAKKGDGLVKLGEGKIYTKSQLSLSEAALSGFEQSAPNISAAARDASSKLAANGNLKDVTGSADDLTAGSASASNGVVKDPSITVDVKSPQSISQTQGIVDRMTPDEKENTDIQFVDSTKNGANGMMNSSVDPKATIDEMRENSIPFTKSELTEFLKSI